MFEQLKVILSEQYNSQLQEFDALKTKIEEIEEQFKDDHEEENYQNNLNALKKKYGIFKRSSKQYKDELNNIRIEYNEKLKQFENKYNEYINLKNELAKKNIYVIQKKLEQLNNANSLEDLKMTEEEALKMLSENQ